MLFIGFFGTIWFYTLVISLFTISTPFSILLWIVTTPFDRQRRACHALNALLGRIILFLNPFWSVKVHNREKVDKSETYVITSNHLSLIDIPILIQLYPLQFKFISKKELAYIPFIGWVLGMAKYVLLSRRDPKSQFKMMRTCENYLNNNMSIGIFPEGTRSKDGSLGRFKDGATLLAKKCNKRVLPICMVGNGDCMPKKGFIWTKKIYMDMYVLDPIDTHKFDKPKEISLAVKDAIGAKQKELKVIS